MKKCENTKLYDPLRRRCICGHQWYFSKWDYLKMFLFGGWNFRCPQCNHLHRYNLVFHCVEDFETTRVENKVLDENKSEVFKQC